MADDLVSIPDRIRSALVHLLNAFDYASDGTVDRWQLAIELTNLASLGATLNDIRWLIIRGYAEHAMETTVPGDALRSFRMLPLTSIPADTRIVLSASGAAAIRSAFEIHSSSTIRLVSETLPPGNESRTDLPTVVSMPEWDSVRRELSFAGQVVKRYRVPARNQTLILEAFQESGWPEFIDDPLPPVDEQDSKNRLQATIKSLNRNQLKPLIRFHGNGNGLQIFWEPVRSSQSRSERSA